MLKRILKWTGIVLGSIVLLLGLCSVYIYFASEAILNKKFEAKPTAFNVNSAMIAEGKRLATIRGCYSGCHGETAGGQPWLDIPFMAEIVTPDLTRIANTYTDVQLENSIRQGIKPDGTGILPMPISMYHHLTDKDLASIVAFLRSLPPANGPEAMVSIGLLPRFLLIKGDFKLQTLEVQELGPRMNVPDTSDYFIYGKYLALTSCTECHGSDLKGGDFAGVPVPSLAVMGAAYKQEDIFKLMKNGIAIGKRENEMSEIARIRFSTFTDQEIKALHSFLSTLHTLEEYQ